MCNDIRQTEGRHAGLDTQEALPDKDSQSPFLCCPRAGTRELSRLGDCSAPPCLIPINDYRSSLPPDDYHLSSIKILKCDACNFCNGIGVLSCTLWGVRQKW